MNANKNSVLFMENIEEKNNNNSINAMNEIHSYDFKTVCNKEHLFLKREKMCNIFLLQFNLENKNKNLRNIVNINMYSLLFFIV
jgi:hypothetical protein